MSDYGKTSVAPTAQPSSLLEAHIAQLDEVSSKLSLALSRAVSAAFRADYDLVEQLIVEARPFVREAKLERERIASIRATGTYTNDSICVACGATIPCGKLNGYTTCPFECTKGVSRG